MHQRPLHTRKEGRAATIWMVTILVVLIVFWIAWTFLKRSEHPGRNNPGVSLSQLTGGEFTPIFENGRVG
jgi:cytochrome c-type biogenesis protein CcmH/NrfF